MSTHYPDTILVPR